MLVRVGESITTPARTIGGGTNKRVSVRYGNGLTRVWIRSREKAPFQGPTGVAPPSSLPRKGEGSSRPAPIDHPLQPPYTGIVELA